MNSQDMMKTKAKPGYWFVNVAALDKDPDWQEQVMPGQPDDKLFGYERDVFLRKQYR